MNVAYREKRVKDYLLPTRIVDSFGVTNAEVLLDNFDVQASWAYKKVCAIKKGGYIVLDFGEEIFGGVRMLVDCGSFSSLGKCARIRFGESVSEVCSELLVNGATNCHNPRDAELYLSNQSDIEFGKTGFRFIRIDILRDARLDANGNPLPYSFRNIFATYIHQGESPKASFNCSLELVNKIYKASVKTVYLNMQNFIWDGVKRDQHLFFGDMHPETLGVLYAFGNHPIIENTIDEIISHYNFPTWFSRIPAYSFWFILIVYDLYMKSGEKRILDKYQPIIEKLLVQISGCVDMDGYFHFANANADMIEDKYFLDWPTRETAEAEWGNVYLLIYVLKCYKTVCPNAETVKLVDDMLMRLNKRGCADLNFKQIIAFRSLAGFDKPDTGTALTENGASGFSTFMSYYLLSAICKTEGVEKAFELMKEYYGGMISLGATTFFEDFDLSVIGKASRIDELPEKDKMDFHKEFGKFCYKGHRCSFCHGWACGPVAFLTEYVLGVQILEPGYRKIKVEPNLCGMDFVEGQVPTPYGNIYIKVENICGEVKTSIKLPNGVELQ